MVPKLFKIVKSYDSFSQAYSLNLRGQGSTQSVLGGFCSFAIGIATLVFVIKRTLYMVSREEPRITQVEQGIELGVRSLPIYNLEDQEFTFGAFAAWSEPKFDKQGEITGVVSNYLNFESTSMRRP
jgi:hypothetical protein